jgi:hypothetical protein
LPIAKKKIKKIMSTDPRFFLTCDSKHTYIFFGLILKYFINLVKAHLPKLFKKFHVTSIRKFLLVSMGFTL